MAKTITISLEDPQKSVLTVSQDDYNKDAPIQMNVQRNYQTISNVNLTREDAAILLMALKNIAESIK